MPQSWYSHNMFQLGMCFAQGAGLGSAYRTERRAWVCVSHRVQDLGVCISGGAGLGCVYHKECISQNAWLRNVCCTGHYFQDREGRRAQECVSHREQSSVVCITQSTGLGIVYRTGHRPQEGVLHRVQGLGVCATQGRGSEVCMHCTGCRNVY